MNQKNRYNIKKFSSFREIVNHSAKTFNKNIAFQIKEKAGQYKEITFEAFRQHYYRVSSHLLKLGLRGARIAVSGKNSYEWMLSYLAAATVGVAVPIDKELMGEDVEAFLEASEASVLISDEKMSDKVENFKNKLLFSDVLKIAEENTTPLYSEIDKIEKAKDEMSVLIFTSGTTGSSKGVMLSQHNIVSNINSTNAVVKVLKSDKTMSILPLHHTYECTLDGLLILSQGATICYNESLQMVARDIKEYSPSILVVVPELLAILVRRIKAAIIQGCPEKYKEAFEKGGICAGLKAVPAVLRFVIKNKVRKTLGGKLRLFIVGAAELDTSIVDDFTALGIRTLQGYGLTECSPLLAGNSDFFFNPKSTGVAIPDVELRIYEPNEEGVGEIIARGENIMLGYYRDEEATKKVIRDGWFHTGDLGCFGEDGALYIKGRIKNIIVTENGKNVYPEELEARISAFEEISDVIVTGDKKLDRTTVRAKIFPNLSFIREKLGHEPDKVELESEIKGIIEAVNSKIPKYKQIRAIEVLSNALEKTTTRKVKRFGANVE